MFSTTWSEIETIISEMIQAYKQTSYLPEGFKHVVMSRTKITASGKSNVDGNRQCENG